MAGKIAAINIVYTNAGPISTYQPNVRSGNYPFNPRKERNVCCVFAFAKRSKMPVLRN